MKFRLAFALLCSAALLAAGCGGDSDKESKDSDKPKAKQTKQERARAEDREVKEEQLARAKKEYEKDENEVGACRNLAMAYISIASPASASDPKETVELPKDRDENLKKAVATLEDCTKVDPKDRDVKQMLASSYMGTGEYAKAAPLLKSLAASAPREQRANAYYAWGLAASNAQDYDAAIQAWSRFVALSPADDPRVKQVQQSIRSLRTLQRQQAAAPASDAADDSGDDEGGDEGDGDDEK